MVSTQRLFEPDLYAMDVEEATFAQLEGTGLEHAVIADGDDYAVRDKNLPAVEIRRAGDDFRRLGAVIGQRRLGGRAQSPARVDLHDIDVDDDRFELVKGTGLEYAMIGDGDDYAVRDLEHPGDIRRPGDDWRKLGTVL
ncbi:hypothetical protein ITP53_19200 [Nonomuraea sp. K274]|uniref:Uncharacterized protein n=1 Tax=Nonomuraea cypriaca TaxID=1187855 RepID=A0A931EZR2_9ACTN|nr:hypothetical protein [Nonomuraea cypriaca]MBF8187822.1 hypothetical protein [Nonomuraea cypriaca]